jgi:hypothetical protein
VVQLIKRVPPKQRLLCNDDFSCVFIRKSITGFCIILVYVDDLNIIGYTRD